MHGIFDCKQVINICDSVVYDSKKNKKWACLRTVLGRGFALMVVAKGKVWKF